MGGVHNCTMNVVNETATAGDDNASSSSSSLPLLLLLLLLLLQLLVPLKVRNKMTSQLKM